MPGLCRATRLAPRERPDPAAHKIAARPAPRPGRARYRAARRTSRNRRILAIMTATAALVLTAPAYATYPGQNGLIAFSGGEPDGTAQLWTVDPHGRNLRELTHLGGDAVNADWSPDGRWIAFQLDAPDGVSVQL